MAAPNIVGVSSIYGQTSVQSIATSLNTILLAQTNKVNKVNSLIISNIDGTNNADVSVSLTRSSVEYYIAKTVTVPANATLVVISKDMGIYLQEGDAIKLAASATGDLQGIISYEIIDDA